MDVQGGNANVPVVMHNVARAVVENQVLRVVGRCCTIANEHKNKAKHSDPISRCTQPALGLTVNVERTAVLQRALSRFVRSDDLLNDAVSWRLHTATTWKHEHST